MSIGQNIQRLRKEAGISQEKLGELIGKTRSAVSYYEKGTIIPRMGVIEDLAAVFGVSKTEIFDSPRLHHKIYRLTCGYRRFYN